MKHFCLRCSLRSDCTQCADLFPSFTLFLLLFTRIPYFLFTPFPALRTPHLHRSPPPSSGFYSPVFSSHCCWLLLMTHITPLACCVRLTYSLPLLSWSFTFTHEKRPFIRHALPRLQALYSWIFPGLTFKWSHSALSISLPHYVPPFSLSSISTPLTLMTSLLLLTLIFLQS